MNNVHSVSFLYAMTYCTVQYETEHIALCTVSHNAMQISISHATNDLDIITFSLVRLSKLVFTCSKIKMQNNYLFRP